MKTDSVTKVMTKDVVCITPNQHLLDVKHIYEKDKFHHHIPVVENDKLVGMVSLLDFMYHISGAGISDDHEVYKKLRVKDILTSNPFYLTTEASIAEVAKVFTKGKFHAVPILENDSVVGIVSTVDVINYFLQES
ncbi:HPP family protein [Psychroserpens sp.]|uniref:CBS domain-containing protein n=1 Tax=Psychroserpens sp. TaxID=2020870 RepID=UPI002B26DBDB|nr:CBS domain-containing protein [Psychroserpens sp.]